MPRGRPRKIVMAEDEELRGLDALQMTVAEVIQETLCGIPGCMPKFHLEDARVVVRKMKDLDLIKEKR